MSRRERVRESAKRVAAGHEDSCTCRTCRAAAGDEDALESLAKDKDLL